MVLSQYITTHSNNHVIEWSFCFRQFCEQRAAEKTFAEVQPDSRRQQPQAAEHARLGVLRELAELLRERQFDRLQGDERPGVQRDVHRRRRLRPDVLRSGLSVGVIHGERTMQLHISLVLQSHVRYLYENKDPIYVSLIR